MSISDIFNLIGVTLSRDWWVIVIILSLIQIVPIKLNPWTWLGKIIGKLIGIHDLSEKVNKLEEKVDRNEAIAARVRILRFGDDLRNNEYHHSQESFSQVLDDITRYNKYCREHPKFENDKTVVTAQVIRDAYARRFQKE